jgi:hypothetical protein
MLHAGRSPAPGTSASGTVPMKPRIASSKSRRSAKGSVFANSALAASVAGSGGLGARGVAGCAKAMAQASAAQAAAARCARGKTWRRCMCGLTRSWKLESGAILGSPQTIGKCKIRRSI